MSESPHILLVDPKFFDVSYVINPWMHPEAWAADPAGSKRAAFEAFDVLFHTLEKCGAKVEVMAGAMGLPDMVFPANAAVVLDRRAIVARFKCAERQGEEPLFVEELQRYVERGVLDEVSIFSPGCFQEGAGDAIWDVTRQHFWAGFGQRSVAAALDELRAFFGREVVGLELATPQFYHLDTCFCPLSGGEVFYYPPAFSPDSLARIHAHVEPAKRLVASAHDAAAFCVNAVNTGRDIVMAKPTDHARAMLEERGYRVHGVDLAPYIMSGGGAYCMTLRLNRSSTAAP